MKLVWKVIAPCLFSVSILSAATLNYHPHWKSDRLPDLYYEVLARAVEKMTTLQAEDGRFRTSIPPAGREERWNFVQMQFIYAPAVLYVQKHPANPCYGDKKVLEMAVRAGDYLASCIDNRGRVQPHIGGNPIPSGDDHRVLYCWIEAYGLLESHLDAKRRDNWKKALVRAGEELVRDLSPRIDRPRYTSPFLGYSPNHFGLRATTIWRMGMLLGNKDWVSMTTPALARFTRECQPGGYWEEHDGPTMGYDYLNVSVCALNWNYTNDPAAIAALRANTDYHMYWCTPDGVDMSTVDERNRGEFGVRASWGLFAFANFPDGRRFARFKLLAALEDSDDPVAVMGLESLGRVAQDLHYHTEGPEAQIPQERDSYRHLLDRPAVANKRGDWVWSISAMLSPQRPLSQFYLDRTCPISLWHTRGGHIIGGGNSKGQPELATFAVKRVATDTWSFMPLDALIRGSYGEDTLFVAHENFSLWLVVRPEDNSKAVVKAGMEMTNRTRDTCFVNIPLRMLLGKPLLSGSGQSYTLGGEELILFGNQVDGTLSHGSWKVTLPEDARFHWPVYTYNPYGDERVPRNLRAAMGVISVPLTGPADSTELRFTVEAP